MDEEEALVDLQREYDFVFEFSSSGSLSTTKVIASTRTSEAIASPTSRNSFYFEVRHAPQELPVAHFPPGSRIPERIEAYLRASRTALSGRLRQTLGLDPLRRTLTFPYPDGATPSSAEQVRAVLSIAQGLSEVSNARGLANEENLQADTSHFEISRKKKFTIKSIDGEIVEKKIDELLVEDLQLVSLHRDDLQAGSIVFTEGSWKSIADHVGFGRQTHENIFEQGGVYVGTPCICPSGRRVGLVNAAISAPRTNGTGTYVEFTHKTWRHFIDVLEHGREIGEFAPGDVILGWYHTHPNGLDVFMSGTDMGTQIEQFHRPWNSAVVINPHRKLVAGFYGRQASPANVLLARELRGSSMTTVDRIA